MSMTSLCLHTLRANYNRKSNEQTDNHRLCLHTLRADCSRKAPRPEAKEILCLHSLRADCSDSFSNEMRKLQTFASTRSVQIAAAEMHRMHMHFLERVLSW